MTTPVPQPAAEKPKGVWVGVAILGCAGLIVLMAILGRTFDDTAAVWDGRITLAVKLQVESSRPVRQVSYLTFFRKEYADWYLTADRRELASFRAAEDFDGTRFTAIGQCSGRVWHGYEQNYTEDRFLVLLIDRDGEQLRMVAEIPAGRGHRNMTVTIP